MNDEKLIMKSESLVEKAVNIKHPMLPNTIKAAIVGAAEIVHELVKREVSRNG